MVLVKKSIDRLKSIRIFSDVKLTPINSPGNPPGVQDALVEVGEGKTGNFLIGAGVSTNSGLVGQISLEQQNFDITNPPHSMGEFLRGQAFKGAGQYFRILLEPGTEFQRYRVTFEEPYLFDTPYSFGNDIYYFTRGASRGMRSGSVTRSRLAGVSAMCGPHRSHFVASRSRSRRASDRNNNRISDANYFLINPGNGQPFGPFSDSAQEILNASGSHFLTSIKPGVSRDTTDSRIFPTTGTRREPVVRAVRSNRRGVHILQGRRAIRLVLSAGDGHFRPQDGSLNPQPSRDKCRGNVAVFRAILWRRHRGSAGSSSAASGLCRVR